MPRAREERELREREVKEELGLKAQPLEAGGEWVQGIKEINNKLRTAGEKIGEKLEDTGRKVEIASMRSMAPAELQRSLDEFQLEGLSFLQHMGPMARLKRLKQYHQDVMNLVKGNVAEEHRSTVEDALKPLLDESIEGFLENFNEETGIPDPYFDHTIKVFTQLEGLEVDPETKKRFFNATISAQMGSLQANLYDMRKAAERDFLKGLLEKDQYDEVLLNCSRLGLRSAKGLEALQPIFWG